jgi:fibronectin-binding autotransporter adhesin
MPTTINPSGQTITQFDTLAGAASNLIASVGPGSSGQVLQSGGNAANPAYSTATFPATATGTGTILRADGTNWSATTTTYPNTNAINTILYASAANVMSALATANGGVFDTTSSGVPQVDTTNFSVLSTGVQVKGNNTNTAPPAGFIGEQIRGTGTGVSISNNSATTIASITLTAGIWDISAVGLLSNSGATTAQIIGISTTTNSTTGQVDGDNRAQLNITATAPVFQAGIPSWRVTIASNTNYFLVGFTLFSTGACTAAGRISGTRVG